MARNQRRRQHCAPGPWLNAVTMTARSRTGGFRCCFGGSPATMHACETFVECIHRVGRLELLPRRAKRMCQWQCSQSWRHGRAGWRTSCATSCSACGVTLPPRAVGQALDPPQPVIVTAIHWRLVILTGRMKSSLTLIPRHAQALGSTAGFRSGRLASGQRGSWHGPLRPPAWRPDLPSQVSTCSLLPHRGSRHGEH